MATGWEMIEAALRSIEPRAIHDEALAWAAVLMLLQEEGGELRLLLTKRTETVRYHKGQISFPGGARDGAESIETTALRETEEEIGVSRDQLRLLGRFHDYLSGSSYRVTPFVGRLARSVPLRANPVEVAYLLDVPLAFFLENEPECRMMERRDRRVPVYFYNCQGEVIWGLTARIIKDFVDVLRIR